MNSRSVHSLTLFLFLSAPIIAMNENDYTKFINPKNDINKRLDIVKNYIKDKVITGECDINYRESDVTNYFRIIPPEDIRIDNEIIPYFFSQELNFLSTKYYAFHFSKNSSKTTETTFYKFNLFENIIFNICYFQRYKNIREKSSLQENNNNYCFLNQLCLYRKLEATDLIAIKKDICFLNLIFKNKITHTTQLPRVLFNKIVSNYLAEKYISIKNIITALEETEVVDISTNQNKLLLALLQPDQWKNNSISFIKELTQFVKHEESILEPLKNWQIIINNKPSIDPLVIDKNSIEVVSQFDHNHVVSSPKAYNPNKKYKETEEEYRQKNVIEKYKVEETLSKRLKCTINFCEPFDIQQQNVGALARTLTTLAAKWVSIQKKPSISIFNEGVYWDDIN